MFMISSQLLEQSCEQLLRVTNVLEYVRRNVGGWVLRRGLRGQRSLSMFGKQLRFGFACCLTSLLTALNNLGGQRGVTGQI